MTSKTFWTIFLVTVFGWFSINSENVLTGFAEIVTGDISGIGRILKTPNLTGIFSEAYQNAIGKDYTWLEYKKETGKDLAIDFAYVGKQQSITRDLITVKQFSQFEGNYEESCFVEVQDEKKQYIKACDEPAVVVEREDAEKFCQKIYGAGLASFYELRSIIGVINPVTNLKVDYQKSYHEMTSTLNPEDSGEYRVFYKDKKNKPLQKYANQDSEISSYIGFRCYIRL